MALLDLAHDEPDDAVREAVVHAVGAVGARAKLAVEAEAEISGVAATTPVVVGETANRVGFGVFTSACGR